MIETIPQAAAKNSFRMVVLGAAKCGKTSLVSRCEKGAKISLIFNIVTSFPLLDVKCITLIQSLYQVSYLVRGRKEIRFWLILYLIEDRGLLDGSFHDNYIPTIEKFYRKVFRIKGQFYQMDILDTGGRQPFPATRRLACLTGDLFLIVFSLDDEESWKQALKLREEILQCKASVQCYSSSYTNRKGSCDPSKIPIVFAANKSDKEQSRNIDMQKIERIIDQFSYCVCVETSAKKNINISKLYFKLFFLANVPLEMTPDLHHNIPPENIGLGLLAKEAMVGASLIYFFGSSGMKKDESEAKKCNNFQAFKLKENEATITSPKKEETREALHNFKQIIKPEEIEELTEKCGKKSGPKPKLGRAESFLFNVPLHHNLLFGVRLSDAYGFLVPNVQRPSVQSDIFGLVPRTGAKSTILQIFSFRDCRTGNSTHCCLQ